MPQPPSDRRNIRGIHRLLFSVFPDFLTPHLGLPSPPLPSPMSLLFQNYATIADIYKFCTKMKRFFKLYFNSEVWLILWMKAIFWFQVHWFYAFEWYFANLESYKFWITNSAMAHSFYQFFCNSFWTPLPLKDGNVIYGRPPPLCIIWRLYKL